MFVWQRWFYISKQVPNYNALTKGYLDSIDFEDLANFEKVLYKEMETTEKGLAISNHIKQTKELPTDSLLEEFIKDCKRKFI